MLGTDIDIQNFEPGTFTYNSWDEMDSYTPIGGDTSTYEYDPEGLRTKKTTSEGSIRYHCDDNGLVIAESNASDQVTAQTIWGHKPLARKINGSYYYYVYNGHGDVIQLFNESGNIVNSYQYDEWGNILLCNELIANPIRYAGEYYDEESGLYYLRARYYDPVLGRFISKDSNEGDITNPLSLNRYSYCAGNPVVFNDPSGHEYRWIREMAAEVGATVEWDKKTRSAIVTYQGKETVYSKDYIYAEIKNDKIYIDDASFFCAIGAFWDNELRKAVIRQNELTVEDYADMVCGGGGVKVTGKIGSRIGIMGAGKAVKNGNLNSLSPNGKNIYRKYEASGWKGNVSGQTPGTAAGSKYLNRDGKLPTTDSSGNAITYKEFDVNNKLPGLARDSERFVRGSDGSVYYTNDHYRSFIKIK